MTQNESSNARWHDGDIIVSRCISLLENIEESFKHKTATFLVDEIINKPPYSKMLPEEIYNLALSETRKSRWYDIDEITRLFMELLKHCSPETRKEICIKAINFMESFTFDANRSVEISAPEDPPRFFSV